VATGRRGLTASGRVALAVVAVLTSGVVLVAAIAYVSVTRLAAADLDDTLLLEAEAFAAAITPQSAADERTLPDASRAYLEGRTGTAGGVEPILIVRFSDGRVLSNSQVTLENAEQNVLLLDPEQAERSFADIEYDGTRYRTVSAPVSDASGAVIAVFQAAVPTEESSGLATDLAIALVLAGTLVVAAGAAISLWVARTSLAPLHGMAATASRVTQSSLDERVDYDGPPDELAELASAIDSMLDRLEHAFVVQKAFVSDASHELRTPIAVIRGNLDLIHHPATTAEERAECLRVIDDEVHRMTRLLEDMLSLTRMGGGPPRPFQAVEAATLVSEVAFRTRALGSRDIRCECDPSAWVLGDPDLLERALSNLVRNAVEHTGEGDLIEITCHIPGDRVLVTIADDGAGINETDLPRIFDRFYRSGERRQATGGGSGLGLAIARSLVELHGGTIAAANREGGGAEFTIDLPRIEPPEPGDIA
jgi:heavy metal sensor kinase